MDKKTARKVDKGGRITIPKNIREQYGIIEGQAGICQVIEGQDSFDICFTFQYKEGCPAMLQRIVEHLTQEEIDEAMSRGNT